MSATGEMITFPRTDGSMAPGYLVEPPPDAFGRGGAGVVLIHEAYGLNDQIKGVAVRLANDGWRALAVDLYDGRVFATLPEARATVSGLDRPRALTTIAAAVARLHDRDGSVGVMGFCMGGGYALAAGTAGEAGRRVPGVDAVCCFYGLPPAGEADGSQMKVPFIGHFGGRDTWITPERVDALEKQLKTAKVF